MCVQTILNVSLFLLIYSLCNIVNYLKEEKKERMKKKEGGEVSAIRVSMKNDKFL